MKSSKVDLRFAYRELATPGVMTLGGAVIGLLAALFTICDPWDFKSSLTAIQRVAFSAFVGASDLLICYSGGVFALYLLRFCSMRKVLMGLVATAPILAAPCGAVIYTGFALFHGGQLPLTSVLATYSVSAMNLLWATGLVFYVLLLRLRCRYLLSIHTRKDQAQPPSGGLTPEAQELFGPFADAVVEPFEDATRLLEALERPDEGATAKTARSEAAQSADRSSADAKQLMARLPAQLGEDIMYLHVSGHYLEVVTTSGSAVILMRLADAVAELHDRGMQVHRSYWVAYRHIVRLYRRDHRMLLCLPGDREIPVSRPHLRAVRDLIPNADSAPTRGHDMQ